jgi:16S rRNA pseudouridine516 synthase
MLNEKKAVIFDLDGTLVDSMWMWRDIDICYLGKYGIELPETLQSDIEGMSFSETAVYFKETFHLSQSLDEIKEEWYEMAYEKYANEVPLKEGALDFLKELKENGIGTGIATSNGIRLVEAVMGAHHLKDYIDVVVTGCEVPQGKPSPDIYLKVADDLQVDYEDCLVFEDVTMGILAGKNAGMTVCAVHDAFSEDQEDEKRSYADYYINSFQDLFRGTYEILNSREDIFQGMKRGEE